MWREISNFLFYFFAVSSLTAMTIFGEECHVQPPSAPASLIWAWMRLLFMWFEAISALASLISANLRHSDIFQKICRFVSDILDILIISQSIKILERHFRHSNIFQSILVFERHSRHFVIFCQRLQTMPDIIDISDIFLKSLIFQLTF